jgi:hypothetical protein
VVGAGSTVLTMPCSTRCGYVDVPCVPSVTIRRLAWLRSLERFIGGEVPEPGARARRKLSGLVQDLVGSRARRSRQL